jgi:hypothetical protein
MTSPVPGYPMPRYLAALRRQLWLGALTLTLVVILACGVYLLATRHSAYVASRALLVTVLPANGGAAAAALAAEQVAAQTAHVLATGQPFANPAFTSAVIAVLRASPAALDATFGAGTTAALASLNGATLATALSATRSGDSIVLAARWSTPGGARALAATASQVLAANPNLAFADGTTMPAGASGRILLDGAVTPALPDPIAHAAARTRLLWSLLLGLAAALGFTLLLAWWDLRAARPPAQACATFAHQSQRAPAEAPPTTHS